MQVALPVSEDPESETAVAASAARVDSLAARLANLGATHEASAQLPPGSYGASLLSRDKGVSVVVSGCMKGS